MPNRHSNATNPSVATRHPAGELSIAALLAVLPDDTQLEAVPSLATTEPDVELVRLCAGLTAALDALNEDASDLDAEDNPLWWRIEEIEERIASLEPTTIAGIVALARLAAYAAHQPDGSENWHTSYTGDWPERVCRAVLRLFPEV